MKNRQQTIRKIGRIALNVFYYSSIVLFSFILLRVFVLSSFKIPTDSMQPTIIPGDYVW